MIIIIVIFVEKQKTILWAFLSSIPRENGQLVIKKNLKNGIAIKCMCLIAKLFVAKNMFLIIFGSFKTHTQIKWKGNKMSMTVTWERIQKELNYIWFRYSFLSIILVYKSVFQVILIYNNIE